MTKSYLQDQYKLVALQTSDLFTDAENDIYNQIMEVSNALNDEDNPPKRGEAKELRAQKAILCDNLANEIKLSDNVVRSVRLQSVIDKRFYNEDIHGITWDTLRLSKKIAEFCSEGSRLMGLNPGDVCFDKIIISWRSPDILRQLVLNGFYLDIQMEDGSIDHRFFRIITASSGQLRTDKVQAISVSMWDKIRPAIECGLSWERINQKLGINANKYLAYLALAWSATERWDNFDIDKVIVVEDFEADVEEEVRYIGQDYSIEDGIRTVKINHIDGCGIILPSESTKNFMFRAPWMKGLLTPFDFLKFCRFKGIEPILKDRWGKEHDLIKEDIRIIVSDSQLKTAKYYKDWDEYKYYFKLNGCHASKTNIEEGYIKDSNLN